MASVIIHDITVDHHGGSHSHTHLGSSMASVMFRLWCV